MYFDYAELQAQKSKAMYMKDWVKKLDAFLKFNEKDILCNSGKISNKVAVALAEKEYKKFQKIKDKNYISDFDKILKKLKKEIKKK